MQRATRLLLPLFFFLLRRAASGQAEVPAEAEAGAACPEAADEHLRRCVYALLQQQQLANLSAFPATQQHLDAVCHALDEGLGCLDRLSWRCLSADERQSYLGRVEGVRRLMEQLCRHPAFQTEYLLHSDCYQRLSSEWDGCSLPLLTAINTQPQQLHLLCTVKRDFLRCVTTAAERGCSAAAADFVAELASTLSASGPPCPLAPPRVDHQTAPSSASTLLPLPLLTCFIYYLLVSAHAH